MSQEQMSQEQAANDVPDGSDICAVLAGGALTACEPNPWGSNYSFFVTLEAGEQQFRGVYKPRQGERPLWDFPSGTLYLREYAAYRAGEALGWSFVPPTVVREGPYGVGSVQLMVEARPFSSIQDLQALEELDLARIAAFDIVTNNADRKGGHILQDPAGKLWSIDHGLCFNVVPKIRTVLLHYCGQAVPTPVLDELRAFRTDSSRVAALERELASSVADDEITAMWQRLDWVLGQGTYPVLDPYHSVPWPPF
ncbi:MAG TPA: SCO1664 family protein [Chloroflexota bacterium]